MSPTPVGHVIPCTTIEPDSNGYAPPGTCNYHGKPYYPSFTLAVIFSLIAGLILLGHAAQLFRHRKSGLQQFALFTSFYLLLGYVARTIGTRHQQNIYITAFSDTIILTCPTLITAFNGCLLVRIMKSFLIDKRLWPISPKCLSRTIKISVPILLFVQLLTCGAIVTGNPARLQVMGIRTYMASIGIQGALIIFLLILVTKFYFHMSEVNRLKQNDEGWARCQTLALALYFSLATLSIRTLYRLVELSQVFQVNSVLPHKEIFFYCFEAAPIMIALGVWIFVPIGGIAEAGSTKTNYNYQEIHANGDAEDVVMDQVLGL